MNITDWQKIITETGLSDAELARTADVHFTLIWRLRTKKGTQVKYDLGVRLMNIHKIQLAHKMRKKNLGINA